MATCAHTGQAVGVAAAHCIRDEIVPRDLVSQERMKGLQQDLVRSGQYIPGINLDARHNLASRARIQASTTCLLDRLKPDGSKQKLTNAQAIMLPVTAGTMPEITYTIDTAQSTALHAELRISANPSNHTPDVTLETLEIPIEPGENQSLPLKFSVPIPHQCYAFVCIMANPDVSVYLSEDRRSGILTVYQKFDEKVAKTASQLPPEGSGIDSFEFWIPQRRPDGKNPAVEVNPPLACFETENLTNGYDRPIHQTNAWIAEPGDSNPTLVLDWEEPQAIRQIDLCFDADYDHPMESVIWGHHENIIPFCVRTFKILDGAGKLLASVEDNHQAYCRVRFDAPVETHQIRITEMNTQTPIPVSLFEVRCFM